MDFKSIQKIIDTNIYSKLPIDNPESISNIDWNLIEYYGLISTAEHENGAWNRLVGQDSHVIEFMGEDENECLAIFMEHDEFIVMTYL